MTERTDNDPATVTVSHDFDCDLRRGCRCEVEALRNHIRELADMACERCGVRDGTVYRSIWTDGAFCDGCRPTLVSCLWCERQGAEAEGTVGYVCPDCAADLSGGAA